MSTAVPYLVLVLNTSTGTRVQQHVVTEVHPNEDEKCHKRAHERQFHLIDGDKGRARMAMYYRGRQVHGVRTMNIVAWLSW